MTELIITQALKPCPFAIGDKVQVVVNPEKGWSFDWENLPPHYVTAIHLSLGEYDIEISETWPPSPGATDGFAVDDLTMVEQAAWNARSPDTGGQRLEEVGERAKIAALERYPLMESERYPEVGLARRCSRSAFEEGFGAALSNPSTPVGGQKHPLTLPVERQPVGGQEGVGEAGKVVWDEPAFVWDDEKKAYVRTPLSDGMDRSG